MFDYSFVHWLTFATAATVIVATPGPDLACILGRTIRGGHRAGLAALAGMCTGATILVVLVTLGLGSLISSSDIALTALKWIGAAYLIYLGTNALFPAKNPISATTKVTSDGLAFSFRQGLFVNLLNPKAILFFMAFLPQFVMVGHGSEKLQLAAHGGLVIVLAVLVYVPMIALADRISKRGKGKGRFGATLERMMGVALIGMGAKVAISS